MDLKDYVKVDDLIKRMNEEYPEGRLITELVNQIGDLVVFKVTTFYNGDSDPICTGHEQEKDSRDKKLEKQNRSHVDVVWRVLFSEKPLYEEMEDIVQNNSETSKNSFCRNAQINRVRTLNTSMRGTQTRKLH